MDGFTKTEAEALVGKQFQVANSFPALPEGLKGKAIRAMKASEIADDQWSVVIEWEPHMGRKYSMPDRKDEFLKREFSSLKEI